MRFESNRKQSFRGKRPKILIGTILLLAVSLVFTFISGLAPTPSQAQAQVDSSVSRIGNAHDLSPDAIAVPLEFRVTDITLSKDSSGRYAATVYLNASNNLNRFPRFASAQVTLQAFNLTLRYEYQSEAGPKVETVTVTPTTLPFTSVSPGMNFQFSVNAGSPPNMSGSVNVQVTGGYAFLLQRITDTPDGRFTDMVNGGGRFFEFSKALVISA